MQTSMLNRASRRFFCIVALLALVMLAALPAAAKDITVQDAAELLQNPPQGLIIVDVRTPAEFHEWHLPGAINIDYFGGPFETQFANLPKDAPVRILDERGHLRTLEDIERDLIQLAIEIYAGHMSEVARRLGIGRSTLYRKVREQGLDGVIGGSEDGKTEAA